MLDDTIHDKFMELQADMEIKKLEREMEKRKRNPELVELDAFRDIVEKEKILEKYPNAIPVITKLMEDYEITGQKEKAEVLRKRLDAKGVPSPLPADTPKPTIAVDEALYEKALALVRSGTRARPAMLQRGLCIGYTTAEDICQALIDRNVVDSGGNLVS